MVGPTKRHYDIVSTPTLFQTRLNPILVHGFDFYAKDFPEDHGSTSWGAEVRYGRHVLEFPIERINPARYPGSSS